MNRITVKIKDCDNAPDCDMFFNAPLGMNEKEAVRLVDAAIRKIQEEHNADYTYDDLEIELSKHGFEATSFAVANERW